MAIHVIIGAADILRCRFEIGKRRFTIAGRNACEKLTLERHNPVPPHGEVRSHRAILFIRKNFVRGENRYRGLQPGALLYTKIEREAPHFELF